MPAFPRPRAGENDLLAGVAQYPSPPAGTDPEVARRFNEIVHSVAPEYWRRSAEVGQILRLVKLEIVLDQVTEQVMLDPSCTLVDGKPNPAMAMFARLTHLASNLRTTLGLTVLSGYGVGQTKITAKKADAAAAAADAPSSDPWWAGRPQMRAVA